MEPPPDRPQSAFGWLKEPTPRAAHVSLRGCEVSFWHLADLYFAPKAPEGKESNWIQTVPGKGWYPILGLYGPLQPWFDKTWRPGEIEVVN